MVLELTDKLKKSAIAIPEIAAKTTPAQRAGDDEVSEVIAALLVLRYSSSEARDAVKRANPCGGRHGGNTAQESGSVSSLSFDSSAEPMLSVNE